MKSKYIMAIMFALLLLVVTGCSDGKETAKARESKETITLKVAVSQPASHAINVETFVPFMEKVTELTDGQVEFDFYPAEQLGKTGDIYDLTADGVTDLGLYMSPYYPNKMPLTNALLTMPGLYSTAYEGTMAYHELTKQSPLLESDFLNNGVRPIINYAIPVYEYWTTGKEIKVPDDLKGLKVKISGELANKAMGSLGASPVNITVSEMYEALERGVVDSISLYAASMKDYGMGELVKYGTEGVSFGGSGVGLVINERVFQGLPKNVQEVLVELGDEFTESNAKYFDKYNYEVIQEFKEAGIKVHELSEDEKAEWQKFYAEIEASFLKEQTNPNIDKTISNYREVVKKYK
ncbi:TRAP transporter substrate-binding protein DctP [Psychrobacillus sp. NPDC096426]|uniref:TRAP transporter substrate-binding protein n=1 Tax=Psychrobacillus sp. NPDC096426 TaxID=3364491 RepID=UPI0037F4C80E